MSENNSFVLTCYEMPINGTGNLKQVGTTTIPMTDAETEDTPFSL